MYYLKNHNQNQQKWPSSKIEIGYLKINSETHKNKKYISNIFMSKA